MNGVPPVRVGRSPSPLSPENWILEIGGIGTWISGSRRIPSSNKYAKFPSNRITRGLFVVFPRGGRKFIFSIAPRNQLTGLLCSWFWFFLNRTCLFLCNLIIPTSFREIFVHEIFHALGSTILISLYTRRGFIFFWKTADDRFQIRFFEFIAILCAIKEKSYFYFIRLFSLRNLQIRFFTMFSC